jgi:putative PIN family toxin of toxin-antitoxin system
MTLRVVFDTNVLFSGAGWGGKPGHCVELVRSGRIRGLVCAEILEELAEKLSLKLRYSDEQIGVILGSPLTFFELVAISGTMKGLQADPKDDKVLECAVIGAATHVVTGDGRHLLPLREFRGIQVVTPADLIGIVGIVST